MKVKISMKLSFSRALVCIQLQVYNLFYWQQKEVQITEFLWTYANVSNQNCLSAFSYYKNRI